MRATHYLTAGEKSKTTPILSNLKPGVYRLSEINWKEARVGSDSQYLVVQIQGICKQGNTIIGPRTITLPHDVSLQLEAADDTASVSFEIALQPDKVGIMRPRTEFLAIEEDNEIEDEEIEDEEIEDEEAEAKAKAAAKKTGKRNSK